MSIIVTGATGHLGHLVVDKLLDRGVPAGDIVATGRNVAALEDLDKAGVRVRRVDFSDPASLEGAFAENDRVLLVSTNDMGARVAQHQAVIDAAKNAGVDVLVYTSGPYASTSPMKLMADHRLTEEAIATSGVPAIILRNGWYLENYTAQLDAYLDHGAVLGSAGEGRISAAARADYAEAAAAVLTDPTEHIGHSYELGGDASFTLGELADAVAVASGKPVVYADLPAAEHTAALVAAGLPEPAAETFVDVDQSARDGALFIDSGALRRLIGHPTTPLADAIKQAVADAD
ncbi:MAG TPA: NAD(P)H-binding protein [Acidimicrobiales bacterium]|nr:NAD(P)H-binding protein [Acidimicrobiales bacterium]